MRLLLDENLPKGLAKYLLGHEAITISKMGWQGKKNGELLRLLVSEGFDGIITVDKSISYQQNYKNYPLAVIILRSPSNKLEDLVPIVPSILGLLEKGVKPGPVEILV